MTKIWIAALGVCLAVTQSMSAPACAGDTAVIPQTAKTPALPAWLARPASGEPAPGVVVLHGCEGYHTRYARVANDLAAHGFVAVAIDTLTPRGMTNACTDRSGSRVEADDARATLAWLRTQPFVDPDRLAVLGYSMGAIAALDLAVPVHRRAAPLGLVAAVAYYPACVRRTAANAVISTLVLDGSADTWTPATPCAALAAAAKASGSAPIEIVTFPNATHAFNWKLPNRSAYGHAMRYDPAATEAAFADTLRFLDAKLR